MRNIINERALEHPDGIACLDAIKLKFSDVEQKYIDCRIMQAVTNHRFDMNVLKSTGYTLNEIMDVMEGHAAQVEVYGYVLNVLNNEINKLKQNETGHQ